jgi:hypothetical protein
MREKIIHIAKETLVGTLILFIAIFFSAIDSILYYAIDTFMK